MRNKQIVNYAFLDYYYTIKSDGGCINFNEKEGRLNLVLEIFKHSELGLNNKNNGLFEVFVSEFYEKYDSFENLFSEDLSKLFKFILKKMGFKILESDSSNENLIEFYEVIVEVYEKILKARDCEIFGKSEDAILIWKNIFGNKFPSYDVELIEKSFKDKRSPYYH